MNIFKTIFFITILLFSGCSSDEEPKKPSEPKKSESAKPSPEPKKVEEDDEDEYFYMDYDELIALPLDTYIEKGQYKKAKAVILRLLEEDVESIKFHYLNGLVAFHMQKYGIAIDEFEYVSKMELSQDQNEFSQKISTLLEVRPKILIEILKQLATKTKAEDIAELIYSYTKLDYRLKPSEQNPNKFSFHSNFEALIKEHNLDLRARDFYIISAMNYYEKELSDNKTFWVFYKLGYLNFLMHWYSDSRKFLDKAVSVADSQDQVFYVLQMLEKLPQKEENELDKLSSLDVSEDMIDEFLAKHSKELNEAQMAKVKEVIREGVGLKGKLEKASNDRERLKILKEFMQTAESRLDKDTFPQDVLVRIEQMKSKADSRFNELEEQIRIKEEALSEL